MVANLFGADLAYVLVILAVPVALIVGTVQVVTHRRRPSPRGKYWTPPTDGPAHRNSADNT